MGKNLIIGQSGGPTAVINSSLYGAVVEGYRREEVSKVYGMVNGVEGFLKGHYLDFDELKESGDLEKLLYTPGAYLGSCRFMLPEDFNNPIYKEMLKRMEELQIGYFCYIGGNDSMDTVSKLSRYAKEVQSDICFIGIPKTVDNDLVITDHTPGFGSAAKYVAQAVKEIIWDSDGYDNKSVTIVEIMGRHAGWLTAAGALVREKQDDNPLLIYLPEIAFDIEKFIAQVEASLKICKNIVVCVSEGIKDANGKFLCEYDAETNTDGFGHKMLSGSGKYLEKLVQHRLGIKVRSVELNVLQRCSPMMMSKTDQEEAKQAGIYGVRAAVNKENGKMVTLIRKDGTDYEIEYSLSDVNQICNKEKKVPESWIVKDGSDVSDEVVAYLRPLIQGQVNVPYNKDGMPDFIRRA